jgi:uroporphyrinogen-III decarboxylase
MMTRRERLTATLRGEPVDRPAVSFYEIGGWAPDPDDPDPFNVYNSPDWRPLLDLAENQTDLIRMVYPVLSPAAQEMRDEFFSTETREEDGSRFVRTTLTVAGRSMTQLTRRDRDIATVWTVRHLLRDTDDVRAYLQLPDEVLAFDVDIAGLFEQEQALGEDGIVMVDMEDPLATAAALFSMDDYTVFALTEPDLFHALLQKHARAIHTACEQVAREFPGRLWRIVGSEYASEPYLPPRLYEEYVVRYTGPMVETVRKHGGFARIHSHGRLKNILSHITAMGTDGLDPIEPPPLGDVELIDVRREHGGQMVLFGNIEICDIETLTPDKFREKVVRALEEGTSGKGRGFVLMPSACPYGRTISENVMKNYQTMIDLAREFKSV